MLALLYFSTRLALLCTLIGCCWLHLSASSMSISRHWYWLRRYVVGGRLVGGWWQVVGGRWLVVGMQVIDAMWQVLGGRWQVVGGRWYVVGGWWQVVGGRWMVVGGRWQVNREVGMQVNVTVNVLGIVYFRES